MLITIGRTLTHVGEQDFTIDLDPKQFRHGFLIGKSGTGKSTLLRSIIAEAIQNGLGLAVIDPHGDLIYDVFNYIPKHRLKDVLYIDPENARIPDIGILDYPDKNQALRVFMTLMEAHSAEGWGKQTASIMRNVTRAALELWKHPTIVHIYLLMADDEYADTMLAKCKNPLTRKFHKGYWTLPKKDRIEKFSHPLNKIEELMEPGLIEFLSQAKSLNFRKLMDDQKIVLCRIPKSYLEERSARILGSFIMMKFKVEAARRRKRRKQFLIIADEFHNFTDAIDVETTFAESRKYGTHYIVTSQTREQLGKNAAIIIGNVSHIFAFRMNASDAEEIEKNIGSKKDDFSELVMLPNYHFKALTMDDGRPIPSNSVELIEKPEKYGNEVPARKAIAWASENTGTPKAEIEKQLKKALRN